MIEIIILPILFLLVLDIYRGYRRKKFILSEEKPIVVYQRKHLRFNSTDSFMLGLSLMVIIRMIKVNDFSSIWIMIPIIFIEIREKIRLRKDIVLYNSGMLFDDKYILWNDIKEVDTSNPNKIIISSYSSWLGKFEIENLEFSDDLGAKIRRQQHD